MPVEKTKEVLELQVPTTLKSLIEALVFAAKEPLTAKQIKDIYEGDGPQSYLRHLDGEELEGAIGELNAEYEKGDKPYRIVQIAGGYQFATLSSYADWIGRLYKEQGRRKLSQSGVESLAIIAYKQPVTKSDIESIRGVNCDYVLKTLLEKELVTIVGRAHAPGRPLLYGTTREFLSHFGLNEITDLPRPREIEEILGESQFETERRMLEAQAGAEKMKEEEPDFKSRLPHIPKRKSELDGEVQIRPKTSQREIKTVERSEVPSPIKVEESPIPENGADAGTLTPGTDAPIPVTESAVMSDSRFPVVVEPEKTDVGRELSLAPEETAESEVPVPSVDEAQSLEIEAIPENIETPSTAKVAISSPEYQEVQSSPEQSVRNLSSEATVVSSISKPVPNKSKWQTWKEKVQGFIKKIFG
jgi:segregation and condensation protein B